MVANHSHCDFGTSSRISLKENHTCTSLMFTRVAELLQGSPASYVTRRVPLDSLIVWVGPAAECLSWASIRYLQSTRPHNKMKLKILAGRGPTLLRRPLLPGFCVLGDRRIQIMSYHCSPAHTQEKPGSVATVPSKTITTFPFGLAVLVDHGPDTASLSEIILPLASRILLQVALAS